MHPSTFFSRSVRASLAAVLAITTLAVQAGKPEWAGHGNGKSQHPQDDPYQQQAQPAAGGLNLSINIGFGSQQQRAAQDYYGAQARAGHCPPGLAKKNNGCLPPGQAKKWQRGQALPRDVQYYPLPNELVVRMGVPPAGYKYVRVAGDILLVAVGTMMVVDAIEDLMR